MSLSKKIRGFLAVACLVTLAVTASAPSAFAFDGLGGGSSGGKNWVEL